MSQNPRENDIAIIGISCRVAGASSPSELWEILAASRDVQKEITRFNSAGYYKPTGGPLKGLTNVRHAYLMDEGIDKFDNGFFSIPPLEALAMDPQQRILLELAYEAVENAGLPLENFQGTDTAVYTGLFTNDYGTSLLRDLDSTPKYHSTGTSNSIAANRLSYFFDLHGPSMVIDTACSSTMVALHQAVLSLSAGEASMALVCGANLIINPDMFIHMSELGFLSPKGRCQSFDAMGDGYARGEGVLALLLKPLGDAIRDGDPIRSVIRGTRINQDGRTNGITMPSPEAQQENMDALYRNCGVSPGDVQYFEAHGTGTAVGDPIELNVGHLEACAAIVGIIKAVECLERGKIPPQMHFVTPNPKINFDSIQIPRTVMDWPETQDGSRRAAVNSFGFGGTNGHVILENYQTKLGVTDSTDRPYLFKISASNHSSLSAIASAYAKYVENREPSLANFSHTLLARRSTLKYSTFLTASTHPELMQKLREPPEEILKKASSIAKVGFVFTGQGAQWACMGNDLLKTSPLFASVIDECDLVLASLPERPSWKIREEISKSSKTSRLYISTFSQPICTALQLGLIELWQSWGVKPLASFGHSSGEIAAAYAAGILSLCDAIIIAFYRGLYMGGGSSLGCGSRKGAMCAVGLSESDCKKILELFNGRIALAAVNSPSSCTLSGDDDAVHEVVELCKEAGTFCRELRVDMAYHSHHMLPLAPRYVKSLQNAGISPLISSPGSKGDMFSSVTMKKLLPGECTAEYWGQNMVSTVRFTSALTEAFKSHQLDVLLEIGPHPALKGPSMDTLASLGIQDVGYFASCFRNKPDLESMLNSAGRMICSGVSIIPANINGRVSVHGLESTYEFGKVLVDVPSYQWDHSTSHWAESRLSQNQRFREFPRHQLLGARKFNDTPLSMSWRNIITLKEVDWLQKTMESGTKAIPPSVFVTMVFEAARQLQIIDDIQTASLELLDVQFLATPSLSVLTDDGMIETNLDLHRTGEKDKFSFMISASTSINCNDWQNCCSGSIKFTTNCIEETMPQERSVTHDTDLSKYIESFVPLPQIGLDSLKIETDGAEGSFTASPTDGDSYRLDPPFLGSVLQIPNVLAIGSGAPAIYRIFSVDRIRAPTQASRFEEGHFNVNSTRISSTRCASNLIIKDSHGSRILFDGIQSRLHKLIERKVPLESLFYKPEVLLDITYLEKSGLLNISKILELVTHKWPMSDVGIFDISSFDSSVVTSHLRGIKDNERPRFRSLNLVNDEEQLDSGRIRKLDIFREDQKFHFLVTSSQGLYSAASHVRQEGLVCVRVSDTEDMTFFEDMFDILCEVDGFKDAGWFLGRLKPAQNGVIKGRKLKVFATEGLDMSALHDHGYFELSWLEKGKAAIDSTKETFDLIMLDCGNESILTTWTGADLLPWIQSALANVGNLMWVTNQVGSNPFSNVAGSFLRTVQSEHPSTKVVSLVFKDNKDTDFFGRSIFRVYDRTVHGSDDVELFTQDSQICTLRYLPDDALSAAVGLVPPEKIKAGIKHSNYEAVLAASNKVVFHCSRFQSPQTSLHNLQTVVIEASIIDHQDIVQFMDVHLDRQPPGRLGHFFAGRVLTETNPDRLSDEVVVGFSVGSHKSNVLVAPSQLQSVPSKMPAAEAVSQYAAMATAFAILDGTSRARRGERLRANISGILGAALKKACHHMGVIFESSPNSEADFGVTFDHVNGLLVNQKKVDIAGYMLSESCAAFSNIFMSDAMLLRSPATTFELTDLQKAFEMGVTLPLEAVLIHQAPEQVIEALIKYDPPPTLFRDDAAYVVVGGLGGLGRYLCAWMVRNGARHLITLSRSGLASEDAKITVKMIESLGAEIQAYRVDATDSKLVEETLADIRSRRPIKGVMNMVLVLENSPLMTMRPEQWDQALRSKVDSTWNLHQSTLPDSLDMFIMFSSISSISGNRTQANYATGNAFQNAMADYRRSIGLPGIAIALGAMSDIGTLANDLDLLRTLSQSGMQPINPKMLSKIMEAAVFESKHTDRSLLVTGFQMFETIDGIVQSKPEQNQLFWTESPEFGFLLDHKFSTTGTTKTISLCDQLASQEADLAQKTLLDAFLGCLSNVLGYDVSVFDATSSLASYGLDSLNAVACRYWFFKQLEIDIPVFDILGCKSIGELVSRVIQRIKEAAALDNANSVQQPEHYDSTALSLRPLSHSQSRLWFLQKFLADKTVYNLLLVCHISGTVDVGLFGKAWSIFLRRHEVLYSKLIDTAEGLQQFPIENPSFQLTQIETSEDEFQDQVERISKLAKSHVFNLEAGELVRGWLLKSPVEWRFFLASHHLAWDRASVPTIFDETTAIYKALASGEDAESTFTPAKYQFIDYTLWLEQQMAREELIAPHLNYWKAQLADIPEAVSLLPTAILPKRPVMKQYNVEAVSIHLDSALTSSLKAFCRSASVTPFMFMTSALGALVCRISGDDDIVIGIADGDRGHTEFDRLVGFTVNMLAIRNKINTSKPYLEVLEDYRKTCLEAYEHRAIPFDYLLQHLDVPRRTSHSPIFQITVNYQMQRSFPECDFGDFKFTHYDHYNAKSTSDFGIEIEETASGELDCVFQFDSSIYDEPTMQSFANTYQCFVSDILATKGLVSIDQLEVIPVEDQIFISSILQPSLESTKSLSELDSDLFPVLFAKAVAANPQKAAIIDEEKATSWVELDSMTNRVANYLLSQGLSIGDRVGICCEPGLDMVIGMYGITKAGGVYVPLDPDFPEERMLSMIEDVELEHVLVDKVNGRIHEKLVSCGINSNSIHEIHVISSSYEDHNTPKLSRPIAKTDKFCCIFTSGTTGRPKGIYIGNSQLRYQMEGYHNCIETKGLDRILLSSATVFDMSLTAIFGTVLHGATMVIASREARYSPEKMVDQVVEWKVSNCTFTTTQLKMLLTASNRRKLVEWTSLRSIVVGGEQIPPWVVRDFYGLGLPDASMFNGYAPAETTVCNSLRKLSINDSQRNEIPLERPLFPTKFYILDESLKSVPIGVGGELYIGGPTVNAGYIKRDEITSKAFLKNPFLSGASGINDEGRLYRTGDSFRLTRDGAIQALGRIGGDRQVKIRGMRTELDEIESVIYDACQGHDGLEEFPISLVAVVYHKTGDTEGVLAAYLAVSEKCVSDAEQQRSLRAYLHLRLRATLPVHMVPSAYVFLPELPRMVSGKIDYKAIIACPAPLPEAGTTNNARLGTVPLNELQQKIANLWMKTLEFRGQLSPLDEFFAMGGHSLSLIHIQNGIRDQYNVDLSLGDMFAKPTIEGMESLIVSHPKFAGFTNGVQEDSGKAAVIEDTFIDWAKESSLPDEFEWLVDSIKIRPTSAILLTGASTMAGAHFICHVLLTSDLAIYCIGTEGTDDGNARESVISNLKHWNLYTSIPETALDRLSVYAGSLSHPTLGLDDAQINRLDQEVHAIYQLDSDVSLLKRYESLRATNVRSLEFLISLAHGKFNNTKSIHYLSTWGVPHLQAWNETQLSTPGWETGEVAMSNMTPGSDGTLGYLKARWVCEALLSQAARRGIPVSIYRSCMCGSSPLSGVGLARTDINRRILEGSLQTGLVPDFGSARGGGMSWITADFLIESMFFLSQRKEGRKTGEASIHHIVSDQHISYIELTKVLGVSHQGEELRSVLPKEWFEALRASGNPEMIMQAAVLESWCEAGWIPFALEAKETLELLKKERGLTPPKVDRDMLLKLVIGEKGF